MDFISGAGIDLSSLCIVEGKVCWDLYIDGLVVSSDGNLLDALGAAIKVQSLCIFLLLLYGHCQLLDAMHRTNLGEVQKPLNFFLCHFYLAWVRK